jgi:hypothetical protein
MATGNICSLVDDLLFHRRSIDRKPPGRKRKKKKNVCHSVPTALSKKKKTGTATVKKSPKEPPQHERPPFNPNW